MEQRLSHLRMSARRFQSGIEQVRIGFEAAVDGFVTLVTFNAQDQWMGTVGPTPVQAGENTLIWSGHDSAGAPLEAGAYTLEVFGFDTAGRPGASAPLRRQVSLLAPPPNLLYHPGAFLDGPTWSE
jgi:hypothetical protein